MSRRRRSSDEKNVELDLAPMIDIVFLLVIFFVVLASQVSPKSLNIQLPSSQHSEEPSKDKALHIELDATGNTAIEGEICGSSSLMAILQSSGSQHVLIFADRQVPSGKLIELISTCKSAGVLDVRVVAEKSP